MKRNSFFIILCLIFGACHGIKAQDALPEKAKYDRNSGMIYPSREMKLLMQFLAVSNPMPATFQSVLENKIEDPSASLASFFEKLGAMNRPIRIVHIGDSHVRGHVFPYVMRRRLEENFGSKAVLDMEVSYRTSGLAHETGQAGVVYHILGVNGATCETFSTPERVRQVINLNPDLVIVSFGTNEAHARRYIPSEHRLQMSRLLNDLKKRCPNAAYLLTTPPGAYVRNGRQGRIVNPRTPLVVETERKFAEENGLALWDMYNIVGGKPRACRNWQEAKMFQKDRIHFTHAGYTLQGLLLHEAFIKAYNNYVGTHDTGNRLE